MLRDDLTKEVLSIIYSKVEFIMDTIFIEQSKGYNKLQDAGLIDIIEKNGKGYAILTKKGLDFIEDYIQKDL